VYVRESDLGDVMMAEAGVPAHLAARFAHEEETRKAALKAKAETAKLMEVSRAPFFFPFIFDNTATF